MKELITTDSLSRILKSQVQEFVTITPDKLATIENKMLEVDRAVRSFSKSNTQTDMKLRTLTMLSVGAPYRTLRQILAQIEKKRAALQETYFNILEKKVELKEIKVVNDIVTAPAKPKFSTKSVKSETSSNIADVFNIADPEATPSSDLVNKLEEINQTLITLTKVINKFNK